MDFVVGAIHIHPALLEQRLEDAEILAQMAEWGGKRNTHGLDSGSMAGANAQAEASWGELGDDLGLLHHHQGMTWEGRYDRGPQLDVLRAQRCGGKDGDTVETRPASGHPDGVETHLLCLLNACEYLMGRIPTDSDAKQSVWHTLSSSPRSHLHVRRGAHDIKVSLVPAGIIPRLGTDQSPVNVSHRNWVRWATESHAPAVTWPHYSPAAAQKCAAWPASGSEYRSARRAHR